MDERLLVTGAAGFIGSHVVDRLLSLGATVVGVDNLDPAYQRQEKRSNLAAALANPRFTFIQQDCADLPGLAACLHREQFGGIVHLAAKCGVRPSILDPVGYARANVVGTECVLELARRLETPWLVFGSSSSVYGNETALPFSEDAPAARPVSPYAATKRAGELLCATHHQLYGTNIAVLRFFTVYGPRQRPDLAMRKLGMLMLQGAPVPVYGDGTSERDYTWIDDVVNGLVLACRWAGDTTGKYEIMNLGGGRGTSLSRLIELLGQALDVEPCVERHPMQPGDVVRTCADVSKAGRLLGYQPRISVEEGITRFAKWLKASKPLTFRTHDHGPRPRSVAPAPG